MATSISRRHFTLQSTATLLAALGTNRAIATQARGAAGGPGRLSWMPRENLLRELQRLLELAAVPGLGLAVVEGGQVWTAGFGKASRESSAAVSDGTVFEAASLGKPVFAYTVLRLADEGVLDLDRPLYDYLPVPDADNPRMRRVTARHVLSNTTGLPNWRTKPGPLEPSSEPGNQFTYSGEGFFYLQRVVERVTEQPFARFMSQHTLEPLDMRDSSFVWLSQFERRMATGYDEHGGRLDVYAEIGRKAQSLAEQWGKPMADWRYEDSARAVPLVAPQWPALPVFMVPNAAASLLTTLADFVRFMALMVSRSPVVLGLTEKSQRAMLTPQVRLNSALSWGLGWGLERDNGDAFFWHWGANMSFRSFAIGDPASGRAVAAFTNSTNGPKVYQRVITNVTGRDHPAFLWFAV